MKRSTRAIVTTALLAGAMVLVAGCGIAQVEEDDAPAVVEHVDGIYRGSFMDRGTPQVSLELELRRNIVTAISFNFLAYRGIPCADSPWGPQYEQAIAHLIGKDIRESLNDLYTPGDFVDDVDGFSGATIRASKVRSAIKDALNRDAYNRL